MLTMGLVWSGLEAGGKLPNPSPLWERYGSSKYSGINRLILEKYRDIGLDE